MGYPFYFLPDPLSGYDGSSVVLQGYLGGNIILQGYSQYNPATASTLPAAILSRFSSSTLNDLVVGGLWYQDAPNSALEKLPYGVMSNVTESIEENTKGVSNYMQYMQVSFFAAQGEELVMDQIVKEWYANFGPRMSPLLWLGRSMVRFSNSGARVMSNDMDAPGGSEGQTVTILQTIIEFLVISSPST